MTKLLIALATTVALVGPAAAVARADQVYTCVPFDANPAVSGLPTVDKLPTFHMTISKNAVTFEGKEPQQIISGGGTIVYGFVEDGMAYPRGMFTASTHKELTVWVPNTTTPMVMYRCHE
jgi:hypothetical protein